MGLDIREEPLKGYLDSLVPPRPAAVQAMEASARERKFPILGPACGQLGYQVARMIGARRIFELGSGFGYSTWWFARAVADREGAEVHHTVWDEALSREARGHLEALGVAPVVRFHVGEAVQALREAEGPFDLVFCDIDKEGYPDALGPAKAKLRPGGVLLVDNMLWGGRIFDPADRSPATEGVREATRRLQDDPDWTVSLLPVRDGLLMATRR
jgi:predicted O-methyltransferase YrrM